MGRGDRLAFLLAELQKLQVVSGGKAQEWRWGKSPGKSILGTQGLQVLAFCLFRSYRPTFPSLQDLQTPSPGYQPLPQLSRGHTAKLLGVSTRP